jgi:tetratricopeptide (TPR) repeat protein
MMNIKYWNRVRDALQRDFWLFALLTLLVIGVYANSFPGAFILDDLHIVKSNELVTNFDLAGMFRSDYWRGAENSGLYRPLTILSLAVNRMIFGEAVWGYHLVNVNLHAGVVLLLWLVMKRLGLSRSVAFFAASLFAVHPIHADVVNIVVGRSELLVALFLLAALLWDEVPTLLARVLVCCCFFAALLSKEHAITFLALLPLIHAYRFGWRASLRKNYWLYAALLLVSMVWLGLYFNAPIETLPRSIYTVEAAPLAHVEWPVRVLTALVYQWHYLAKQFVPFGLQAVYSIADLPPFVSSVFSLTGLSTIAATLGAFLLLLHGWRKRNVAALFGVLYVISFAPVSNILLPIGVSFAERLTYLPSVWFCAGVAALYGYTQGRAGSSYLGLGMVAWLCFLTGVTVVRNPDFSSEIRLWSAEVKQNSADFLGWSNLAESLASSNRDAEAEVAYQKVAALAPDFPGGLRSRAAFLRDRGRYAEALQAGERALAISIARQDFPVVAFDHVELADALIGLQAYEEALDHLDKVDPAMGMTTRLLELRGKVMYGLGRYPEAMTTIERIVVVDKRTDIRLTYALAAIQLERFEEARSALEENVKLRNNVNGWNLLGVVCALQEDWVSAIAAFEMTVKLQPKNPNYRRNLDRAFRKRDGAAE